MAPHPTPTTSAPEHVRYMRLALAEARKSIPVETAFCVGAVIVSSPTHPTSSPSTVLATGYSRELPGNTHAEQCALDKIKGQGPAAADDVLAGASIYTTMEPCSERLSGNVPCVQRILATGISSVFIGVEEPKDFVECEGTRLLREAGRQVFVVVDPEDPDLGKACLQVARGQYEGVSVYHCAQK
ncbi:DRAP deaminase [Rhodotorula mucilaginosa]|uniref:DRAP deaminase n=1 Tax=Rhodotorula mucilaginosa TaxID=5537 RepID=A0A9P6W6E6_RHOMI|nr:DRAP deaminase [Rhodotorula mucilaginosa]